MSLDTHKKEGKELQGTEEKQNANPLILGGIITTFYKPRKCLQQKRKKFNDQSPGGWIQRHQENFRLATTLQV